MPALPSLPRPPLPTELLPGALHPAHRTAGILGAAVGCLLMLLGIAALP